MMIFAVMENGRTPTMTDKAQQETISLLPLESKKRMLCIKIAALNKMVAAKQAEINLLNHQLNTLCRPYDLPPAAGTLGQRLKKLRKYRNKTLIQLSTQASVALTTLAYIEQDHIKSPGFYTIYKLAKALDAPLEYFVME